MRGTLIVIVFGALAAFSYSSSAEMDASECEVKKALRSATERGSVQSEIEAEERTQRRREAERVERERAQAREREATLAARPYPVRLIEARCNGCHRSKDYDDRRYGWLGWQTVILRMQLLNGAEFGPGERGIIARYLSDRQPAGTSRSMAEWVIASASCVIVFVPAFVLLRMRRRKRDADRS